MAYTLVKCLKEGKANILPGTKTVPQCNRKEKCIYKVNAFKDTKLCIEDDLNPKIKSEVKSNDGRKDNVE